MNSATSHTPLREVLPVDEAPVQETTLFDNDPIVSVDVNLGKRHTGVDFDYDAYHREADRQGMPSQERGDQRIEIKGTLGMTTGGSYRSYDQKTQLSARGDQSNKMLIHEMQHATDDANGTLLADARYAVGMLGVKGVLPASVATLSAALASLASESPLVESIHNTSVATTIGLGAAAYWGYYRHPMERRARAASYLSQENILTLSEKPRPAWYKRVLNKYTVLSAAVAFGGGAAFGDEAIDKLRASQGQQDAYSYEMPAEEVDSIHYYGDNVRVLPIALEDKLRYPEYLEGSVRVPSVPVPHEKYDDGMLPGDDYNPGSG